MQSFKAVIFQVIVLVIMAVGILVAVMPSMKMLKEGSMDMDSLDYQGDIDGTYVTGTIYIIYDYYCETSRRGQVVSREYIIDAGEDDYMGMLVQKSDMEQAEKLMEAYYDFIENDGSTDAVYAAQYEVKGTIKKMPSDSQRLYSQYLLQGGISASEREHFLPYYLDIDKVGVAPQWGVYLFLILAAGCIIASLFMLISVFSGRYQKEVRQYIASSSSPDMTREHVEEFLKSTANNYGLRCNQEFLCGQQGASTIFRKTADVVWVYTKTVKHKRNFITVARSYYLMVGFVNGSLCTIDAKDERTANAQVDKLATLCPRAITGYAPELEKMFLRDLTSFLNIRYNKTQPSNTEQANFNWNGFDS
ncbi:MAG: hypothetical protein NC413_14185 [Muribaculum sp.]|nr:hypothetical protein [Muribaculum sp.]